MMQPSANGIAALFQGNPAALQQRVQKEQQAQPGLPPDLKELMALQILTEKTDAAQRQQAMNQLNQAGGPNMPTVAQTLQERAKQALQARMMQAQQQAQMPPQPQPIPTAPPADQPEVSPEMMQQLAAMQAQGTGGLDQLRSNVGENYAGGGIIAFAKGDEVPRPDDESLSPEEAKDIIERMKERTAPREEVSDASSIKKALAFAAGLPAAAADVATLPINLLRRYVRNPMDESPRASLTPVSDIRSEYLDMNKEPAPKAAPQAAPVREAAPQPRVVSQVPPGGQDLPQGIAGARNYVQFKKPDPRMEPPAPTRSITGNPPAAPLPVPTGILTPEQASQVKQVMLDRLNLSPYERERMAREEAEKFIGAPETASLQTLADELAAKRQSIARQREENQGLREWMRGIALAPRGLTSAGSAVAGSEYVRGRERQFEAQDFEALQKMLETQVKISDIKRGWRKDLFMLGKAEFDKVYKDNFDAAKALGESDEKAKKLAQEAILAAEGHQRDLEKARIYTAPQLASNARIDQTIAAYKKANPNATEYEALMAAQHPNAYLAPNKQKLADLRAAADKLAILADPAKSPLDPEAQRQAAMDLVKITKTIATMGGVEVGQSLSEADKALINKYLPKK